ncbi:hypothetical protein HGA91_04990 [candidate division WWE3 bacterium]|nr:hypothetical protein [candidate division WWE3 bacterium]
MFRNITLGWKKVLAISIIAVFIGVSGYGLVTYLSHETSRTIQLDDGQQLLAVLQHQAVPLESTSIESAGLLYLISGVVNDVTPAYNANQQGISFHLIDGQGNLLPPQFMLYDSSTSIVHLDSQGESQASIKDIRQGDAVKVNYYVDLKSGESLVTKIALLTW